MPHSATIFDDLCRQILRQVKPRSALDVGTGAGKYADLLREHHPGINIIGYEQEPSYLSQFELKKKYDELRCESAESILASRVREHFDLCIFGDVLEHLRKSLGQDLIHFLLYRAHYILLVVPLQYLQDDHDGVLTEAHVSSWHPREFQLYTDGIYVYRNDMWLGLLRGFETDHTDFLQLLTAIQKFENQAQYLPRSDL
jgi:trans-aconitate methyltransferase